MTTVLMGTLGAFLVVFVVQWVLHERDIRDFERRMGIRDER